MSRGFVRAKFGPYAEDLNHALQKLEGHYTRGYGDRNTAVALHLMPGAAEEAEEYLEHEQEARRRVELAAALVHGFETPYGLELLSTVHWAAKDLQSRDLDAIVLYVRDWTPRKGQLFTHKHVARALERLIAFDLVPA